MLDWIHGNSRLPLTLSIVELLVDMDCQGCEKKVRRAISKLEGVDSVEIDVDRQKVTITGYVDREEVLKMVKRTGRTAEFWPFPYNGYYGDYYTFPTQYLEQSNQKINHGEHTISYGGKYDFYEDSSLNGYNGYYGDYYTFPTQYLEQSNQKINHGEHTISYGGKYDFYEDSSLNGYHRRPPQKVDENAVHLFSDDNVHACAVM